VGLKTRRIAKIAEIAKSEIEKQNLPLMNAITAGRKNWASSSRNF
jgi:hypothetical protein